MTYRRLRRAALAGAGGAVMLTLATAALAEDHGPATGEQLALPCAGCHGADGHSAGNVPPLFGRSKESLLEMMQGYKRDEWFSTIMTRIVKGYSDEELDRMAEYIADNWK